MQKLLDPRHLESVISEETGLAFEAATGVDSERQRWYLLCPRGLNSDHTFGIRTTLGWRRLRIDFEPGKFAGSLLSDMRSADADGRAAFRAVLDDCLSLGARIELEINGIPLHFGTDEVWVATWNRLSFSLHKGQVELGTNEGEPDADIVYTWTVRFAAAIVAILPTEELCEHPEYDVIGYPEGALTTVQANRYERDRRNRAAAIAIHGTACKACGLKMGARYGSIAAGLIEVHHVTPVSQLGAGYVIDPTRDLIPLCPNCHAVVHRRVPPFTVSEIVQSLEQN